jgi:Tfp pilus assembly protein PilO
MFTMSIKKLDRICLSLVIIISILVGYGVLQMGIKQQMAIRQGKSLLLQQTNDLKLAEANMQQLKASLETTRVNLQGLNERIPEKSEMGALLKELDGLIKKRGVVLVTVQPQMPVKEKLYTKIPVHLVFKGSFFNIYRLFQDLESMQRLVVMEKVTIGTTDLMRDCQVELTALLFERESLRVK